MKRLTMRLLAVVLMAVAFTFSYAAMTDNQPTTAADNGDVTVDIKTTLGDIRVKLFGATPRHRDNFVKLVREGYYDGVLFHRVIRDFMVQTGDPNSRTAAPGQQLGDGDPSYTIEAEIGVPGLYHKRGALAAARTGDQVNPERRSSGSQFYIVTGRKFSPAELDRMEQNMINQHLQARFNSLAREHMDSIRAMQQRGDREGLQALQDELVRRTEASVDTAALRYTPQQRDVYMREGGAPHLDGGYTVFGEVVSGMDVVEKIQQVETDSNDRPVDDVRVISMKVVGE